MIKGGLDSEPGQRLIYDLRNVYHLRLQFVRGSKPLIFETPKQKASPSPAACHACHNKCHAGIRTVTAVEVEDAAPSHPGQRRRPCLILCCRADHPRQNWLTGPEVGDSYCLWDS